MPVTNYAQIKPGLVVSIVLKADQRTGRQVQGTVSQLLTRHNHPRGIKVKLTDGRVGRVEQILSQTQTPTRSYHNMSSNPWSNADSQGNPYTPPQGPPPQQQQRAAQHPTHGTAAPTQGIQQSDTEQLLEQQGDRAEQVEHMQQYEANAAQTEDDRIQAQLQKEFPNIDSSLIAAIYNERKGQGDLAEVKELLQELNAS